MADRYWRGGSGTWNQTTTTNWSTQSGGAGGASVPGTGDSVFFDQAGTYTVTFGTFGSSTLNCLNFTVSAGTVTFTVPSTTTTTFNVYGNFSIIAGTVMTVGSGSGATLVLCQGTSQTMTTNGVTLDISVTCGGSGTCTLQDSLTVATARTVRFNSGTLDLNGMTMTYAGTCFGATGTMTLTGNGTLAITTFNQNGAGTLALGSNMTFNGLHTHNSGTLNLSNYTYTVYGYSSSSSTARGIDWGTGKIVARGPGTYTYWQCASPTSLTYTGTPRVECTGGGTGTKTISCSGVAESLAVNMSFIETGGATFSVAAGCVFKDLYINGSQTVNTNAITIYGNYTYASTNGTTTLNSISTIWSFLASSGSYTVDLGGVTHDYPFTFGTASSSATWTLVRDATIGVAKTLTLTGGTLALGSYTFKAGLFNSNNSNTRTLNFGTGKIWLYPSSTATLWQTTTVAGMSVSGSRLVECSGGGGITKTFNTGTPSEDQAVSFSLLDTSATYSFSTAGIVKNLTVNGTQTVSNSPLTIYGGYSHSTANGTTTFSAGANAWTFAATSGNYTISASSVTHDFPWTFGSATSTATWTLGSSVTVGTTRTATLTNGTFNLGGYTFTTGIFTTGVGTKTLSFNGGTLAISGSGATAFNNANPTGFTSNAGSSAGTITLTSATAKTFVGGGATYAATLNQGGSGDLTITGNSTFSNFSASAVSSGTVTVLFTSGTTNTFTNFTGNGVGSNYITVNSTTLGSTANIYSPSAENNGIISLTNYRVGDVVFRPFSTAGTDYIHWYLGTSSAGALPSSLYNGVLFQNYDPNTSRKVYVLETGSTWQVPSDFNIFDNKVHIFGGGGASTNPGSYGGAGSGGGYTLLSNIRLYNGQTIGYTVGAGGATSGAAGGLSRFNFYIATGGQGGGTGGGTSLGGTGTYSGGRAANAPTNAWWNWGGGGGGGAGGPGGNGYSGSAAVGSSSQTASYAGQSGGGTPSGLAGGTGGNFAASAGYAGSAGGTGIDILNTFGAGAGGGGGGVAGTTAGAAGRGGRGGRYGAGGGGGANGYTAGAGTFAAGGSGGIVIEYKPSATSPPPDPGKFGAWFS